MDRIVERLPGDRASRRTRVRTLLRLGTALGVLLLAGIVLWQFQATKDYAGAVFASTAVVAVVIGLCGSAGQAAAAAAELRAAAAGPAGGVHA